MALNIINKSNTSYPSLGQPYKYPELRDELQEWRDSFTIGDAIRRSTMPCSAFTVAVGGGCSALFSIRTGYRYLFTTEVDTDECHIAEALTNAPCLGDTFDLDFIELREIYGHCNYLKSGMPCTDYSASGSKQGATGDTGFMYNIILQVPYILELEPDVVCLKQVEGALTTNDDM